MSLWLTGFGAIDTNERRATAFSALIWPAGRCLSVLLPLFMLSGCVTPPYDADSLAIMPRDSNQVIRGNIYSSAIPRVRTIVIDIDRRIYMGNTEPTEPNQTYGFARAYGANRYAAPAASPAVRNDYYKAILSSADRHVLRCDLTQNENNQREGLCVDDFGRIYDVVSAR